MFRLRKRPPPPTQAKPGNTALRGLYPFRNAADEQLERIAKASRFLDLPADTLETPGEEDSLVFLESGAVDLVPPQGPRRRVSQDTPAAAFPLPLRESYKLEGRGKCRLIQVPGRFLTHADGAGGHDPGFEFHEGDIEDQVYLDFYQALTTGRCELPSMPDIAHRIAQVIDDPTTASEHIARVIQSDPALAARVLSVVNSAAYNTGQPITSLQQAVSRLGRRSIRDLVFSFIVRGVFRTQSQQLKQRMKALWHHSCEVAAICAVLARYTEGLDPERAMLVGLVHDIGVVPVLDNARQYPELMQDLDLLDRVVRDLRGEIGALTMHQWKLDEEFVQAAVHAEDWHHLGTALPTYLDVVLVAQLHAGVGSRQMHELPAIDSIPAFRKVADGKLTPRGSLVVIDQAEHEINEVRQMLESA